MANSLIGYSDEYSEVDLLGGNKYYDGLTSFITKCSTPMTISIQGDWGTGKTTALNLIQKKVEQLDKKRYNILWFRTWQYSKFGMEDNMALSLMINLHSKLSDIAKAKKIKLKDSTFPIKNILVKGTGMVLEALSGSEKVSCAAESVTKKAFGIEDIEDMAKQLEQLKDKIQSNINEIIAEDERLIIFIDDLDRLEPRISIELLESLKIFLDCKKCVFVLAVDSQVVYQGVKSKYGDDFGEDKAKKFFDKIIQVPFNLPVNQYDLNRYIDHFISDSSSELNQELTGKYCNVVTKLLNNNPRSIKRAFNLLALYEEIMSDLIKKTTDKINLFSIILFQIKDPASYASLVEAAKSSYDKVTELLKQDEYQCIFDALELKDAQSNEAETNELLTTFIELLVSTSQISVNASVDNNSDDYEQRDSDKHIEAILSKVRPSLRMVQLNNDVINFVNTNNVKVCSFRIKDQQLNIVVYGIGSTPLNIPANENLLNKSECNKNNITIKDNQIGFYKSWDHITFVDVHNCKNQDLLDEILKFYDIYES